MKHNYLIMDMRKLLDSSAVGVQAAEALEKKFQDDKNRFAEMVKRAQQASGSQQAKLNQEAMDFETQSVQGLESERTRLRTMLMERAAPIMERLATEKGASLVLDRNAVVFFQADADITDIVIREVDEGGAL